MPFQENAFTNNFYNTIGVDFKIKNIEIDNQTIKLQIVNLNLLLIFSGIQQVKIDLEQSHAVIIVELKGL